MSPNILTEPERTNEFKQGYQEGFEAGKACIKKELKELIKSMKDIESLQTSTSSSTFNILNQ